jgi:hypothetical protein
VSVQPVIKDSSSEEDLYSASTAPSSPTPSFQDAISTPLPTTPPAKTPPTPSLPSDSPYLPRPSQIGLPSRRQSLSPLNSPPGASQPTGPSPSREPIVIGSSPIVPPTTNLPLTTGLPSASTPDQPFTFTADLPSSTPGFPFNPTLQGRPTAPAGQKRPTQQQPTAPSAPKRPRRSTLRPADPLISDLPSGLQHSIHRPQAPPVPSPSNQDAKDHANAIKPCLEKPSVQTLLAYSAVNVPERRLHARQAALFTAAADRAATAFLKQPKEKQLLDFLLLPRVLGIGLQQEDVPKTLKAFPTTLPDVPETAREPPGTPSNDSPAKRATKLLEKGYIGRASRALIDPTPLAPDTPETLNTLYAKHPIGHENPFGNANPTPGQNIEEVTIRKAIRSINREKAPGLSGWTRPLLDIAIYTANSPVIKALTHLANMIRQGTAPGVDLLCASRLIGLQKPDGGVRPIAIGDLIYKVALKAILLTSFRPSMLLPNQLGVSTPGGVEPIIVLLNHTISGPNRLKTHRIASLDLVNAFNRIGRTSIASSVAKYAPSLYRTAKWAYNQPSILVTNSGHTLASAEGVRQGDPIAPLLFSLALRPLLEHLQTTLPKATIIAYLDDIYILNPESSPILPVVSEAFKHSPVALNRQKSTEERIDRLRVTGMKALGTFIGPELHRRNFLQGKIDKLDTALKTLRDLPKQHALLLLRGSIHLLLRHLQRQLYSEDILDLWKLADLHIKHAVETLIAREPGDRSSLIRQALLSIPVREGGLGLPIHALLAPGLFRAATEASRPILEAICPRIYTETPERPLPSAKEVFISVNQGLEEKLLPTLSKPALKAIQENASFLGRYWLRTLPTQKHNLLADSTVTEALRTRLLLPVKPPITPCTACGAYPEIGHEDTCRGAERRWIIRHNQVTRAFITTLSSREDLKVESEPTPVYTANSVPENSKRPDFSVLLGTSRHYYDVQIVAINKDSAREEAFATLTEAANAKQLKYKDLGPVFHPLIFSAGGLMEQGTAKTYKALQGLLGPSRARWLDSYIASTLTQARGIAATSIIARK